MKRTTLFFLLIFFALNASAQLNFGLKAGYNSSLTVNSLSSVGDGSYNLQNVQSEFQNNLHAGVFARVFIKKWYLQPELLYSLEKKEFDLMNVVISGNATNVETYMSISTVQVPLYLGYKLLDLKLLNLRLFGGPKFIMDAGSSLGYRNLTAEQISGAQLAEEFKKSQVDLELGAGIDVLMFAIDAKVNLVPDIASKFSSISDVRGITMPTSNLVISLSWKLF